MSGAQALPQGVRKPGTPPTDGTGAGAAPRAAVPPRPRIRARERAAGVELPLTAVPSTASRDDGAVERAAAAPRAGWRRNLPLFPLAIFLLALALRCGFVLAAGLTAPPPPWGDDPDYDAIARGLSGPAHVYANTWFPPGYPLFLAMIYAVAGPSMAAVRIVQAILSAVTCCVTYVVARDAFGTRAGQVTAVLLALYPAHVYMAWRLMAETLFTLLLALAVLAAQRAVARAGRRHRGDAVRLAAGSGLALGAATMVKSNLIVLMPLILLWLAFAIAGKTRRRVAGLAAAAALAAGCALPLLAAPLASRFSPASPTSWLPANGGPTLWWSNNPLADGYFIDPDHTAIGRDFIERHGLAAAALASRDPVVRDHADRSLAVAWVRENPGAFTRLVGRKLWNAFGLLPRAALFKRNAAAALVQQIAYGTVLPLVVIGLWLSRRRWREAMPLYLVLASHTAMTVLFYGTPRFTLVVIPFMLAFAGLAAAEAAARWWPRQSAAAAAAPRGEARPVVSAGRA